MHQPAVLQTDVHKRAEIDDVQHRALQLHARLQVLDLEDVLAEDRRRQVVARIAQRPGQRVENVVHCRHADFQLLGINLGVNLVQVVAQLRELRLIAQVGRL